MEELEDDYDKMEPEPVPKDPGPMPKPKEPNKPSLKSPKYQPTSPSTESPEYIDYGIDYSKGYTVPLEQQDPYNGNSPLRYSSVPMTIDESISAPKIRGKLLSKDISYKDTKQSKTDTKVSPIPDLKLKNPEP